MHQGISYHLRGEGLGLQGHSVAQVSDTQQGHEGEGDMRPDTGRGPMVYRTHFQVVFGHPEGIFHLQYERRRTVGTQLPERLYGWSDELLRSCADHDLLLILNKIGFFLKKQSVVYIPLRVVCQYC